MLWVSSDSFILNFYHPDHISASCLFSDLCSCWNRFISSGFRSLAVKKPALETSLRNWSGILGIRDMRALSLRPFFSSLFVIKLLKIAPGSGHSLRYHCFPGAFFRPPHQIRLEKLTGTRSPCRTHHHAAVQFSILIWSGQAPNFIFLTDR